MTDIYPNAANRLSFPSTMMHRRQRQAATLRITSW
jgi:hypothetical protein